jgi:hypothetical protein
MTRNELIETLARYYGLRLPEKDSKGRYIIEGHDWEAGCSKNGRWLSLEDIVCALESNCW